MGNILQISKKCNSIGPASSIELNELVYKYKKLGKNPIVLSYGEAPFVFSDFNMGTCDFDKGAHYSESMGIESLRQKITEDYHHKHDANLDIDSIMITAGSKIASFIILSTILNPDDTVYLHEPSWVSYQEHVKLNGGYVKFIGHDVPANSFSQAIELTNFKSLILNNPNNPRGYLYSEMEIRSCAEFTKSRNAYLIVDESYSDFTEGNNFFSATKLINDYPNVIIMNSFSKNFGLSGWRVGFVIANQQFIRSALKLNQHLITCAPTILQNYLVDNYEKLSDFASQQMSQLMFKRPAVEALLQKYSLKYLSGNSTFYFFVSMDGVKIDAKNFCKHMIEKYNVAVIPGNAYGENLSNFIRISFGVEPLERIEEGLKLVKNAIIEFS